MNHFKQTVKLKESHNEYFHTHHLDLTINMSLCCVIMSTHLRSLHPSIDPFARNKLHFKINCCGLQRGVLVTAAIMTPVFLFLWRREAIGPGHVISRNGAGLGCCAPPNPPARVPSVGGSDTFPLFTLRPWGACCQLLQRWPLAPSSWLPASFWESRAPLCS